MVGFDGNAESCSDPQWVGGATLLRVCTLKSNGWPRIVIGTEAAGKLYRGDGVPSSAPALMAAIAADAHVAPAAGDTAALTQALQSKLSAGIVQASAPDYANYKQAIEAARLAGAADNYAIAEANYQRAVTIEERLFGSNSAVVGTTRLELALQISNQGRFAEAGSQFLSAQKIIEASPDKGALARLDSYLALDAANQRDYARALTFARQATALRREEIANATRASSATDQANAAPVSQGELAHNLRIEAEMALRLGDLGGARAAAEESLWIISEEPGLPLWWRADTIALIGEINERQGRVFAANHDLIDARDLNTKLFGSTAPTALANLRLGAFYTRQQLYPDAVDAFRLSFAIAAKDPISRTEIVPEDVVQFITADMAAGTNADSATREAEVFRASQFAGSGVADQTIARVAARQAAGDSALAALIVQAQQAARERDRARVELAAEFAKSDEDRKADIEQSLDAKVRLASATADDLAAKVDQKSPQYAKLAQTELASVQAQLGPKEAMISFVIGDSSSYALVVRHDSFAAVSLVIQQDSLVDQVSHLRTAFASGPQSEFGLKNSYALYHDLFSPLESKLAGIDHLIVVPGATLSNLPLALLVSKEPAAGAEHDYKNAEWLVTRFAISEVPSPRALELLHAEASHHLPAPRAFLGLGNPDFHGANGAAGAKALADLTSACRVAGPIPADLLRSLPPLAGTAAEVQTVGGNIGGGSATILLGAQATEANLRAQAPGQYKVIYFATHGILPGQLHCAGEPALALSPPAGMAASTDTDGMLSASEIAQMPLNADLVVLSACNTAESTDGLGGGALEGLSDAFFAAGARAVLASHWEVKSDETETLMKGVFDPANRALGLAQALRQAQLKMIRSGAAHPINWAAFTIIGDDESFNGAAQRSAQLINGGH